MSRKALRRSAVAAVAALTLIGLAGPADALGAGKGNPASQWKKPGGGKSFSHIATFDVMAGNGSAVAEIVDTSKDGKTLAYTDAINGAVGFVDISDPENPVAKGTLALPGSPTSLVIKDGFVVVGVDTTTDFTTPSGKLL